MKRILAFVLALTLMMSLCAFGVAEETVDLEDRTVVGYTYEKGKVVTFGTIKYKSEALSGITYIGSILNNSPDGYGIWIQPAKDDKLALVSFDNYIKGVRQGDSVVYYENGSYIKGEFADGLRQGVFSFVDKDGKCWEYIYTDGELTEKKELGVTAPVKFIKANEDGTYMTVDAQGQVQPGHGYFKVGENKWYIGEYVKAGTADGYGIWIYEVIEEGAKESTGVQCWIGHWEKNQLNGEGIYIAADGTRTEGVWENGTLVK